METFDWTFGLELEDIRNRKTYKNISGRGLVYREGRYLMLTTNRGDVIFPGGRVESGESFKMACCREVLEETGYQVIGESNYLGHCVTRRDDRYDKGAVYEIEDRFYICQVGEACIEPNYTASEKKWDLKPKWMTQSEIAEMNTAYQAKLGYSDPWAEKVNSVIEFYEKHYVK